MSTFSLALQGVRRVADVVEYDFDTTKEATGLPAPASYFVQRLPTEPVGSFTLTLTNLVVGSSVQVSTQGGQPISFQVAASSSEVIAVPAYPPGNAANNLRIKVRKGSAAPFYQPYETQATAFVGAQSIFVSQIPD